MELQQERFEAWLFSQPDTREFIMSDCERCLIASFIRENTGFAEAVCGWDKWAKSREYWNYLKRHKMPGWAIKLIDKTSDSQWTVKDLKARYQRLFKFPPETESAQSLKPALDRFQRIVRELETI